MALIHKVYSGQFLLVSSSCRRSFWLHKGFVAPMAVITAPEIERIDEIDAPTTETETLRERGGWSLRPQPRVGLDLGSDEDLLILENLTTMRGMIYHNYHCLGLIVFVD